MNTEEKFIFDYFVNQKTHEVKIGYRFVFQSLMKTQIKKLKLYGQRLLI